MIAVILGRVYSGRKVGPDRAREDLFDYVTDDVFERKTYKSKTFFIIKTCKKIERPHN